MERGGHIKKSLPQLCTQTWSGARQERSYLFGANLRGLCYLHHSCAKVWFAHPQQKISMEGSIAMHRHPTKSLFDVACAVTIESNGFKSMARFNLYKSISVGFPNLVRTGNEKIRVSR